MKIEWQAAARDALIILVLVFVGVQGTARFVEKLDVTIAVTACFVAMAAGFCLAGCLSPRTRFKHLPVVAVIVWLLGTVLNSVSRSFPVESWGKLAAGAVLPVAAAMLVGGALSLAIVRTPEDQPAQESRGDSSSSQA